MKLHLALMEKKAFGEVALESSYDRQLRNDTATPFPYSGLGIRSFYNISS